MSHTAADLEVAERHVRQAVQHIARQREIVSALARRGHPVDLALTLLSTFESTLRSHESHRDSIAADLRSTQQD